MSWPPVRPGAPSKSPLRWTISLVGGALLLASIVGAPPASATLPGEVVDAAGSAVKSLTAPPASPSSPPSPAPVAPPSVATPPLPQAPDDSVELPAGAAPTASHVAASLPDKVTNSSSSATHLPSVLPSVDDVAGGAREPAGTATRGSTEATQRAPASTLGPNSDRQNQGGGPIASGGGKHSIEPAEAAPLRRFFAYVWPAIALWEGRGPLALSAGWENPVLPPLSEAAQALLRVKGIAQTENSPPPAGSQAPDAPPATPFGGGASTGVKVLLYVAMAALLGVLALAVREELGLATRLPGRHR